VSGYGQAVRDYDAALTRCERSMVAREQAAARVAASLERYDRALADVERALEPYAFLWAVGPMGVH